MSRSSLLPKCSAVAQTRDQRDVVPQANREAPTSSQSYDSPSNQKQTILCRKVLQKHCLQPSGLARPEALESRTTAWLYLLGISDDHVLAHARVLSHSSARAQQASISSTSSIVSESLSSQIPIDEDGWQVASDDIIEAITSPSARNPGKDGDSAADDGWKVVKSKKPKRRNDVETASSGSPPDSPRLSRSMPSSATPSTESLATSTPTTSPNPNESRASSKSDASRMTHDSQHQSHNPVADQQLFPNLSLRDIEQVAKDVERSFIGPAFKHMFPITAEARHEDRNPCITDEKAVRRQQLSHLVLTTLSRHPALSYFQGYHDILSVVLLTLAPRPSCSDGSASMSSKLLSEHIQQAHIELVSERISLHVIRDNMSRDLFPVMGQLKLLGNLLRLCDPTLAQLVDRASPMPFFALPWLLTLLTHDMSDVAVMQRALEFVLAFGPAAAIYLCAAVLLTRKEVILGMDEHALEDPAMLHTILGKLPLVRPDFEEENDDSAASKPPSALEGCQDKRKQGQSGGASNELNAIYTDPDVELPSLASDRALAASQSGREDGKKREEAIAISVLLQQAVRLMEQFPLDEDALQADKIMGPNSALFTWPRVFGTTERGALAEEQTGANTAAFATAIDWTSANTQAETILTGPTEAIVIDPHPTSPISADPDTEKHIPTHPHYGKLKPHRDWDVASKQTRMLAVVGISGLLVAALFTASQNPASAARVVETTEETKRVLTLIVSLLSRWGRVIG